jgi:hypothetical protein
METSKLLQSGGSQHPQTYLNTKIGADSGLPHNTSSIAPLEKTERDKREGNLRSFGCDYGLATKVQGHFLITSSQYPKIATGC